MAFTEFSRNPGKSAPTGKIAEMVHSSTPIFATESVTQTIAFYRDVLGFPVVWTWGTPVSFGSVSWGNVTIMFNQQSALSKVIEGHQHWFDVDDIDDLYSKHLEGGAMIFSPIEDKPWGRREYTVRDINGYHLRFGGSPLHHSAGSSEFPKDLRIVRRMPTTEEHRSIAGKEFYSHIKDLPIVQSWGGIVAETASGEVVGELRIMLDAPGWFSLWDVAVLSKWQGKRIGSKMVEEAIAMVAEAAPGASIHLFTYKPGFYQKLGFANEQAMRIKV